MALNSFSKFAELMVAVAIVGCVGWLVWPRNVTAILDGSFRLELRLTGQQQAVQPKILAAYFWNQADATAVEKSAASASEFAFRPVEADESGVLWIELPFCGKLDTRTKQTSHHRPKYLVVQLEDAGSVRRKTFTIPNRRGETSISIDFD